eukprot:1614738-Karenia_brevis.AAC.1
MALLENEIFLSSATDGKCFFYVFRLPRQWLSRFALSKRASGKVVGCSRASTYVAVTVVGMGWPSA